MPPPRSWFGTTGGRISALRSSPPPTTPPSSPPSWEEMAHTSGSWEGATTTMADVQRLRWTHRIPEGVATRLPGEEIVSVVEPGERVVFVAHFDRGFGLPANAFFRAFLEFFGLQPHHLPVNAYVTLSCYAAFCEGYAGLWPDVDFWSRLFYIKAQTTDSKLRACGAASLYACRDVSFPKIPMVDSVKKWQTTFFYVKNENLAKDLLNLPEFSPAPPAKTNWGYCPKPADPAAEVNMLLEFLRTCVTRDRLTGADLLCTFISRRVLLLQRRVHKICYMSGRLDPTRTSKVQLSLEGVARWVNHISQAKLPDNWQWGMEPFSRNDPPALNFPRMIVEDGDLAEKVWEADLPTPEDERDRAASEDENPDAAAQASEEQGEPSSTEQPGDEEVTILGLLRVTPLTAVPPAAAAVPPLQVWKRATGRLEAAAKKQRRLPQKQIPEAAGSAIKFPGAREPPRPPASSRRRLLRHGRGGSQLRNLRLGSGRARRRSSRCPLWERRTSSSAPPPASSGSGSQDEPAHWTSHPTIGDLLRRSRPEVPPTGGDGGAPGGGADSHPRAVPSPEPMVISDLAGQAVPPSASEPAREESARSASADARALIKAKGPAVEPQRPSQPLVSLHVAPAATLAHVVSAPDSSLGCVGTMEKEWRDTNAHEVTSREGRKGVAPMELFFSDFRALLTASATEADNRLKRCEKVAKSVNDKRADLYNKLVASYHRAKTERAEMARELEATQAVAAQVPQLHEELRLSRAQCTTSQETAKALAAQAKETEGELACLHRLEANHLAELEAVKRVEQERVDSLNRHLGEVDE
ncbi:hypothetical protein ACQ4PT_046680 [Festuca glaucescens]